jgi:dienelactone hydrolase
MKCPSSKLTHLRFACLCAILCVIAIARATPAERPAGIPWDMAKLSQPPATYPAPGFEAEIARPATPALQRSIASATSPAQSSPAPAPDSAPQHIHALFFDGLPWHGKPTRVFAFIGMPEHKPGDKVPGMVLVHGGGGTAFAEWVKLWTSRGYAAIAMDTCGCTPGGEQAKRPRHEHGGPPGWGGWDQTDEAVEDQWSYHAVADVVLAHSLLRAQSDVDTDRTGVTGISWGGYLTCIVAGVDDRFRFAVPVYGCGFLGDNSTWLPNFAKMGKEKAGEWLDLWDPSRYLPRAKMPLLWVDGTNDFAYPLDSLQKSYRLPTGPRTLCTRVRMPHGQGPGATPEEIRAFADSILKNGAPLARITGQGREGDRIWAAFESRTPITKAEINFTEDSGAWKERKWETLPAEIVAEQHKASAPIPAGAKVFYLNLIDERGLVVSSEHIESEAR